MLLSMTYYCWKYVFRLFFSDLKKISNVSQEMYFTYICQSHVSRIILQKDNKPNLNILAKYNVLEWNIIRSEHLIN